MLISKSSTKCLIRGSYRSKGQNLGKEPRPLRAHYRRSGVPEANPRLTGIYLNRLVELEKRSFPAKGYIGYPHISGYQTYLMQLVRSVENFFSNEGLLNLLRQNLLENKERIFSAYLADHSRNDGWSEDMFETILKNLKPQNAELFRKLFCIETADEIFGGGGYSPDYLFRQASRYAMGDFERISKKMAVLFKAFGEVLFRRGTEAPKRGINEAICEGSRIRHKISNILGRWFNGAVAPHPLSLQETIEDAEAIEADLQRWQEQIHAFLHGSPLAPLP